MLVTGRIRKHALPIDKFIITVFCWKDDDLKSKTGVQKLRQRGFAPALSDSEVITMEGLAERQTASEYLKKIEKFSLIESRKAGKAIIYYNHKLLKILCQ